MNTEYKFDIVKYSEYLKRKEEKENDPIKNIKMVSYLANIPKYCNNNRIAVILSTKKGSPWCFDLVDGILKWNPSRTFDPSVVRSIMDKLSLNFVDLGLTIRDLKLIWIPKGEQFTIILQNGYECVIYYDPNMWINF